LFEREGTNGENLPETHAFLKKLRSHIDEKFPETVFLAEANMWPEDSASYFGDGDECHMNYHFPVMPRMFMALQMEDRYPITDIFDQTPAIPETCQWAMFLRNHDELTLEMVTDEERDYMYKVYAKDPKAKINLGIRHRLAPLMGNDRRRIELMNCLLFSMPGTPVIYYGDEIGMGDNFYLGDRDGVRTPMQWSPDRNAGFSSANPHKLYLPVILDPEYNYESVNVEMQRGNTSSLFWFMKRMINMRKKYKVFGRGDMKFIHSQNAKILAFTRSYEDETLLVIVNLSKYAQPAELDISNYKGYIPVELFSKNKFPIIKEDVPYLFTLGSHEYEWFILQKTNIEAHASFLLPTLEIKAWEKINSNAVLAELQHTILPGYLERAEWFVPGDKGVTHVVITNQVVIETTGYNTLLLLFEVQFKSGLPESYQLPITFAKAKLAQRLGENCPEAVLANIKIGNGNGLLVDALYTNELQQLLIKKLANNESIKLEKSQLYFTSNNNVKSRLAEHPVIKSKINTEDGFTSIAYDNGYILKMYRKVDPTTNPDVEITQYLTEQAQFKHIPQFSGAIEWKFANDIISLGMLQVLVENHGDGYRFMLTRINNYIERILARNIEELNKTPMLGTLIDPVAFDDLDDELQILLGGTASEQARFIGNRIGEMHLALAADKQEKYFTPEDFSLHYQRSLFSNMQATVREAYQQGNKKIKGLSENSTKELEDIFARKDDVLKALKRIYKKKIDVIKIRIHGNLHLGQVLFTGRDVVITDFGGDPLKSFSDRRLKRSPLRDVASMIRSFRYVAYEGFLKTAQVQGSHIQPLLPFAKIWAHYMTGFFMKAYLETVSESLFIPKDKGEMQMMIDTFILEMSLFDLKEELSKESDAIVVPIKAIKAIIN
jgi:maltose alpha-D-glucosyltransferase/alpha-amylase